MLNKPIVFAVRWIVVIAVFGSIIAGAAIIITGFISILNATWDLVEEETINIEVMRAFSVEVIEVADAFLLGVVMFIIAVGLYQLFFDEKIDVPTWLEVSTLSDLKEDLLAVTIVLLGISFLGRIVDWDGNKNIIYYGVAIAAVLVPLVAMFGLLFHANSIEDEEVRQRNLEREHDAAAIGGKNTHE